MKVTDVWFRTPFSIKEISDKIGAKFDHWDGENYWEWIISEFEGVWIDITRKDTNDVMNYDLRIFVCGGDEFPEDVLAQLVKRLQSLNIEPIYVGQWHYLEGNSFKYETVRQY